MMILRILAILLALSLRANLAFLRTRSVTDTPLSTLPAGLDKYKQVRDLRSGGNIFTKGFAASSLLLRPKYTESFSLNGCSPASVGDQYLYHGTLERDFWTLRSKSKDVSRDTPYGPAWFSPDAPPHNTLPFHVPMYRRGCAQKFGWKDKLFLKIFEVARGAKILKCGPASRFYSGNENEQFKAAKVFCNETRIHGFNGYSLSKDVITGQPEWILCTPNKHLKLVDTLFVGALEKHDYWVTLDVISTQVENNFKNYNIFCFEGGGHYTAFDKHPPPQLGFPFYFGQAKSTDKEADFRRGVDPCAGKPVRCLPGQERGYEKKFDNPRSLSAATRYENTGLVRDVSKHSI